MNTLTNRVMSLHWRCGRRISACGQGTQLCPVLHQRLCNVPASYIDLGNFALLIQKTVQARCSGSR